jgi:hypothetical protein
MQERTGKGFPESRWDRVTVEQKDDQWTTYEVRVCSSIYDVRTDGGAPKDPDVKSNEARDFGGFGFLVEARGTLEVKDVRVKVITRKSHVEDEDEDEDE